MAYVVARANGRFEIRESVHTPKGPRARSLAGFTLLTDEVLAAAARRAIRPFDAQAVIASGRRAGVPEADERRGYVSAAARARTGAMARPGGRASASSKRFVEASRRMARASMRPSAGVPEDPGAALIDLLGFADAVTAGQPPRQPQPLRFPALRRLVEERRGAASRRAA